MAEKTVQKFEDQLNCSICLDTYTDPKLLQCFHVYCQKCLVKLVVRDYQGQLAITCPICRQATPVPANGVAGLQPAFQINHFLEIMEEHKKATADPSASAEKVGRKPTSLTSRDKIKVCCGEHDGREVEFYCETCGEPICYKCAVKGGKHRDHDYEELDTAFQQYKKEITASLEPMEKQLTTINKALAQLDTRCGEISDQRAVVESDVHGTFERLQVHLQEALDIRKTELIGQLHQITQGKLKGLAVQRDQMETTQAQLNSCLGFMKESLETGSQEEVLLMKTMVFKQVKELTATLAPDMLKPNTKADMGFSAFGDITAMCKKYGQISSGLFDDGDNDNLFNTQPKPMPKLAFADGGSSCAAAADDDDDDLFSSGSQTKLVPPGKSSKPKVQATPTRTTPPDDDLFSSGSETTLSSKQPSNKPKAPPPDDNDDDDLFSDPLSGGSKATPSTAPVKATPSTAPAKVPAVKEVKKKPQAVSKPFTKREPDPLFGSSPEARSDDDLFSSGSTSKPKATPNPGPTPVAAKTKPTAAITKQPTKTVTKKSNDLFDDSGDDDDLFSAPKSSVSRSEPSDSDPAVSRKEVSPSNTKKKPVGGRVHVWRDRSVWRWQVGW